MTRQCMHPPPAPTYGHRGATREPLSQLVKPPARPFERVRDVIQRLDRRVGPKVPEQQKEVKNGRELVISIRVPISIV